MNFVFNTVTLLLFIFLVYYLSKNTNKRCDNIHYVPMYEYEIIYKTDDVIPEKNPDTITPVSYTHLTLPPTPYV